MTFFYPLRNKTAFDIFDKAKKLSKNSPRMEPRRASYVCGPLLGRVGDGRQDQDHRIGDRSRQAHHQEAVDP
jgi:hypothetical protein